MQDASIELSSNENLFVTLSRVEHFSSAHSLKCDPSYNVSNSENQSIFGHCTQIHGHNYKLIVSIQGKVDPKTGMIMNISKLKPLIKTRILDLLDHKLIDKVLGNAPSTVENIALFCWNQLYPHLEKHLFKIVLYETEKNFATVSREQV